jgi:hypothetical protein
VRIAVVYESLYGNTRRIAEAVAEGLRTAAEVSLVEVRDAGPETVASVDLLVVGGPTHIHGMSSRVSRKGAADDARKKEGRTEPHVQGPPLREWLDSLDRARGARAAAFDTRLDKPKLLVGSAAKGIARRLRHLGYELVAEESFLVADAEGPLLPEEVERARAWGESLAAVPTSPPA